MIHTIAVGCAAVLALVGNCVDGATTAYALRIGARELNPLIRRCGLVPIKIASTLGTWVIMYAFWRHGHPILASVYGMLVGGGLAAVAYHNLSVIHRQGHRRPS